MTWRVRVLSLLVSAILTASAAQAQPPTPSAPSTPLQPTPRPATPSISPPPTPGKAVPARPAPPQPEPAQEQESEEEWTASDLFEWYELIGTFAIDCNRPLGPRHPRAVYIARDDGTVEYAMMTGRNRRQFTYIIDQAEETESGVISFSMFNRRGRLNVVYHIWDGAIRAMESSREDGTSLISEGYGPSWEKTQWFYKCE